MIPPPPIVKYEYKVFGISNNNETNELNNLLNNGWVIVNAIQQYGTQIGLSNPYVFYTLKKEK